MDELRQTKLTIWSEIVMSNDASPYLGRCGQNIARPPTIITTICVDHKTLYCWLQEDVLVVWVANRSQIFNACLWKSSRFRLFVRLIHFKTMRLQRLENDSSASSNTLKCYCLFYALEKGDFSLTRNNMFFYLFLFQSLIAWNMLHRAFSQISSKRKETCHE